METVCAAVKFLWRYRGMIQLELIDKVRERARRSDSVQALMMYGSFTQNAGDRWSDVEFYVFVRDEDFDDFSSGEWIGGVSPFYTRFFNEFGTEVVIFRSLIRGEFHFLPCSEMKIIGTFSPAGYFPDVGSMALVDKTGELKVWLEKLRDCHVDRNTDETVAFTADNLLNILLLGINVLRRGEKVRALECLGAARKYYLQFLRLQENTTDHWINPAKNLEREISADAYRRYARCISDLDVRRLEEAFRSIFDGFLRLEIEKVVLWRGENADLLKHIEKYIY